MERFTKKFLKALKNHAKLRQNYDLNDYEIAELAERIDNIFDYMVESARFNGLVDCLHYTEHELDEMKQISNQNKNLAI